MRGAQKVGRFIGAVAIVATAACGNRSTKVDDALARDLQAVGRAGSDLQLAPRGGAPQTVVSAIEGGPTAAPVHAAKKPAAKPVTHPAPQRSTPAPATRAVVQAEQAPQSPAPQPQKSAEPDPLPPFPDAQGAGKARQKGTYSTEADIFRRMPWIRP